MNPRDAEKLQIEIFRRMTPQERLECCFRWTNLTYDIARSAIRTEHPDWSPERIDREIGRRITGIDVTKLPIDSPHEDGRLRRGPDGAEAQA
jgi:hypothetical protein